MKCGEWSGAGASSLARHGSDRDPSSPMLQRRSLVSRLAYCIIGRGNGRGSKLTAFNHGFSFGTVVVLVYLLSLLCVCTSRTPLSNHKHSLKFQQYTDSDTHRLLLNDTNNSPLKQDMETLLKFKALLEEGNPYKGYLYQNWLESDVSPCNWTGITCGLVEGKGGLERVTGINFTGGALQGALFNEFSTLTALSSLCLAGNQFKGEIPGDLGDCKSLTILNLSSNFLEGTPNFTALTNLQSLDLSFNRLNGSISPVLPNRCDNLSLLNLSSNNFTDSIPKALANCPNLKALDLSENDLVGQVWAGFGNMEEVFLCCNNLSGPIPEEAFNESCRLKKLDLSDNKLNGSIPEKIYKCKDLVLLDLSQNQLLGEIPPQFGLLEKLNTLILRNDNLSRDIPVNLTQCKNLSFLDMSGNNFGGRIQPIFGELESLRFLILHDNSYETNIPAEILKLPRLVSLDISHNSLSGALPVELGSMQSIRYLVLAANRFEGNIPEELGQLSRLQILDLSSNSLTGSLPRSLGNLTNLLWLMLANNSITGTIPPELGQCKSLLWLNLAYNQLVGGFPERLSGMGSSPNATFEYNNRYLERIPRQSGECLSLRRWLPADYPPFNFVYDILNRRNCKLFWEKLLQGRALFPICPKGNMGQEVPIISGYVQLTGNNLTGPLPKSIGGMEFLSLLLLGINNFDGQIPREIAHLPLVALNVSFNNFSNQLPSSLGEIKCLQRLDLSHNNFSGQIPGSFTSLNELTMFNISYNPLLRGVAPTAGQFGTFDEDSYIGDELLCFQRLPNMRSNLTNTRSCTNRPPPPPPGKRRSSEEGRSSEMRILVTVISVLASAAILMCGVLTFLILRKTVLPVRAMGFNSMDGLEFVLVKDRSNGSSSGSSRSSVLDRNTNTIHFFRGKQFTYTDILIATANFSDSYVIGSGGFGTVYKGKLRDGSTVAVKKLQQKGPQGEREFLAEMQTLGSHEFHENLVPLLGCCLFGTEKLIVYDFMCNGSLEDWLYERSGGPERLDWATRYKIALGTAKALKFLHHDCSPAVIHRDMKASNILLDKEFNPHVTDFGLARFVDGAESHVSTVVAGTLGYVPPEYSQSWRATTRGDVYSYGVVLLELATGRRPLSDDGNLVEWVRMLISGGIADQALDPVLHNQRNRARLIKFLHLGYICTHESPYRRPNMEHLLTSLQSLAGV